MDDSGSVKVTSQGCFFFDPFFMTSINGLKGFGMKCAEYCLSELSFFLACTVEYMLLHSKLGSCPEGSQHYENVFRL